LLLVALLNARGSLFSRINRRVADYSLPLNRPSPYSITGTTFGFSGAPRQQNGALLRVTLPG
jgi:hypothetical protein